MTKSFDVVAEHGTCSVRVMYSQKLRMKSRSTKEREEKKNVYLTILLCTKRKSKVRI